MLKRNIRVRLPETVKLALNGPPIEVLLRFEREGPGGHWDVLDGPVRLGRVILLDPWHGVWVYAIPGGPYSRLYTDMTEALHDLMVRQFERGEWTVQRGVTVGRWPEGWGTGLPAFPCTEG